MLCNNCKKENEGKENTGSKMLREDVIRCTKCGAPLSAHDGSRIESPNSAKVNENTQKLHS